MNESVGDLYSTNFNVHLMGFKEEISTESLVV